MPLELEEEPRPEVFQISPNKSKPKYNPKKEIERLDKQLQVQTDYTKRLEDHILAQQNQIQKLQLENGSKGIERHLSILKTAVITFKSSYKSANNPESIKKKKEADNALEWLEEI